MPEREHIIESRPIRPNKTATCSSCRISYEYSVPKNQLFSVRCYQCQTVHSQKTPTSQPKAPPKQRGTDEKPVDMSFYELLGVSADATPVAIKKAYYVGAVKSHPDKNPDDPGAEARFKELSEAYQVLSDPQKRSYYNQHGIVSAGQENAFADPEAFFKQQFGGDKFADLIGEISIARDFGDALRGDGSDKNITIEQRQMQRQERVELLTAKLKSKLALYSEAFPSFENIQTQQPLGTTYDHIAQEALSSFKTFAQLEAEQLKTESYGVELLNAIGYTYTLKADQWNAVIDAEGGGLFTRAWGFGARVTGAFKEKGHIIADTVGTLRTAIDLQNSFTKLKQMEKDGIETPESEKLKSELEHEAASKGMEALWRGSKLEVEAVIRQVCDDTLSDSTVSLEIRRRRAVALRVLGDVYESIRQSP